MDNADDRALSKDHLEGNVDTPMTVLTCVAFCRKNVSVQTNKLHVHIDECYTDNKLYIDECYTDNKLYIDECYRLIISCTLMSVTD